MLRELVVISDNEISHHQLAFLYIKKIRKVKEEKLKIKQFSMDEKYFRNAQCYGP